MPIIGLLSDSHGRAGTTRRAVDLLLGRGVNLLIHLGDVGNVEVIDALVVDEPASGGLMESHLVFGNTDWDADSLGEYARDLGVRVDHPMGRIDLSEGGGGGWLAFCHGHEEEAMEEAVAGGARYLCHGHTHKMLDVRRGSTRVINPGALFRAKRYTAAVLDTDADRLEFIEVA